MREIDNSIDFSENVQSEVVNAEETVQQEEVSECIVENAADAAMTGANIAAEAVSAAEEEAKAEEPVSEELSSGVFAKIDEDADLKNTYEAIEAGEYQKMRDKAAKKAAKKMKKAQRKAEKKKGGHFILKLASVILCAVLFGGISAGTFLGIIHATGYDDKFQAVIDAADREVETQAHISTLPATDNVAANTTVSESTDVAAIFENTIPAVVSITSKIVYESQGFGFFFNGGTYESTGAGSGIIIADNDKEILIVTNYHVVENASSLVISFVDGEEAPAIVKGTSELDDLAVVSVSLSDISEGTLSAISKAAFGDSDALRVGDRVIAIGNALGYGQSLTVGYVSALSRDVTIDGITRTLLQTDAAINPGNSGGALLNEKGELIGINSAKYSDTDVEGMGFAIPISSVKELIEELMNKEPLVEVEESQASFLGITPKTLDSTYAFMYNMPEGVYVYELTAGGPAEQSGIQVRDIITRIDGTSVSTEEDLRNMLKYYAGGKTVEITLQRAIDGVYQELVIPVTLGFRADYENIESEPVNPLR